ncbi:hypothetical protein [Calothrix sp. 336/3]|nr:hypothetical protein [Calothrix sp. 336/3]
MRSPLQNPHQLNAIATQNQHQPINAIATLKPASTNKRDRLSSLFS